MPHGTGLRNGIIRHAFPVIHQCGLYISHAQRLRNLYLKASFSDIWVNSCGVPVAKKCPLLRTKTSLQRSASSKYAVLTSTLIPSVRINDSKISHVTPAWKWIYPTVGSSSNKSSGERTNVQARLSFCFIPPDNLPAWRLVNLASPVICSNFQTAPFSHAKEYRVNLHRDSCFHWRIIPHKAQTSEAYN